MELSEALKVLGMKKFNPNVNVFQHRSDAEKTYRESAMALGGSKKQTERQLEIMRADYNILLAWERLCYERQQYNPCPVCGKLTKHKHEHCPVCGKIMQKKFSVLGDDLVVEKYVCNACEHSEVNVID